MEGLHHYDDLINDVNEVIEESKKIETVHDNIKPIKDQIINGLKKHRADFERNAIEAKELAELDKYTIAFFGETNAGKSTIIETLRILGNEKSKEDEYAEIDQIQSDINSLQTRSIKLEQGINNSKAELIQLEGCSKEVNSNKEELGEQYETFRKEEHKKKLALKRLEESLMQIIAKCNSIEKDQFTTIQQDEKVKNEIRREKNRLHQKEKSLAYRLLRWIKSIFNKEHFIDETKLEALKIKEFEYTQAIKEFNTILSEHIRKRNELKANVEAETKKVTKLEEQLGALTDGIGDLEKKLELLHNKRNNLEERIEESFKQVSRNEINITELTANLEKLGDGRIIGTGVQDFTKGVHYYELYYNGQPIVLIDVPGIEGNEDLFTDMIKKALIKAHAIFYINGSNKKPEERTLEKIKYFLRDQTEVYSISNVKGKADTYEFDEDRVKLSLTHKDLDKTSELTKETLKKVLQDKYKGHLNLQGLLAFLGSTKFINPNRKDFIRAYKNTFNYFENSDNVKKFSNIQLLENLIVEQQPYAETKIKIANLQTLIGVSTRFANDITIYQEESLSDVLIKQVEKEFNGYRSEVKVNKGTLKSGLDRIMTANVNRLEDKLREFLYNIIDKKYEEAYALFFTRNQNTSSVYNYFISNKKDKDALEGFVNTFMEQLLSHCQQKLQKEWNDKLNNFFEDLQTKKKRISSRLSKVASNVSTDGISLTDIDLSVLSKGIDYGNILSVGFNLVSTIGGMALTGAALGSAFPGIGNVIGAIVGAIIGAIIYGVKAFFGGESKEAKLKRELEPKLNEVYLDVLTNFQEMQSVLLNKVEVQIVNEQDILNNCLNDLKKLSSTLTAKTCSIKELIQKYETDKIQLNQIIKEPILY